MNTIQIFMKLIKTLPTILIVYVSTAIFSIPLGIIFAIIYTGKNKFFRNILAIYAWIFRGTPLMLQLLVVYYGLPMINIFGYKIIFSAYPAAIITFAVNYAAYLMEIIRSGIESIEQGQYEAAQILGYNSYQKMRYIILPQAIRRVLPALGSEAINLIKDNPLYMF